MVTQGSIAPDFTLETDRGAKVTRRRFSLPYSANKPWTPSTTR